MPPELVFGATGYRRECVGLQVPRDVYIHVSGIDLIRDADGSYLVLEDNGRTPSGVSYVLKNRQVMKQVFPLLVRAIQRAAGRRLHRQPAGGACARSRPPGCDDPTVVVLTPGHLQLGLLRAQLPGPADGRRAGRRAATWCSTGARSFGAPPAACSGST